MTDFIGLAKVCVREMGIYASYEDGKWIRFRSGNMLRRSLLENISFSDTAGWHSRQRLFLILVKVSQPRNKCEINVFGLSVCRPEMVL